MENLLNKLNSIQRQIVEDTEGYVLTLAGAGAGKTRVLTHRIAYLLHHKVAPWRILAVTFTNKAAKEMKGRVVTIAGSQARDLWIGTFHSVCVRMLRAHGIQIGLANNFTIIDKKEQSKLLKQCIVKCGFAYEADTVASTIGVAKNDLLNPQELRAKATYKHEIEISHIYEEYEAMKVELNYMDFDDLIMKAVYLLQVSTEVRDRYQEQFKYVLADEGQDTNRAQYTLLDLLTDKYRNLFIVGDIDQSIYKWRGARVSNMIKFQERYPEARIHLLEQNYRSTGNIVLAANTLIEHNKERLEKTAWTDNVPGDPIVIHQADDDLHEADFVTSAIRRIMEVEGREASDFAVLYRTNRQSRAVEVALTQAGISYRVLGGTSFYDRKEIKDITGYLRLLTNEYDALSIERIINVPRRGIGDTTISKIQDYANICQIPFPKAVENVRHIEGISKATKTKIEAFTQFVSELRDYAYAEGITVVNTILELLKRTGYMEQFSRDKEEDSNRMDNIQELINVADAWDKENTEQKTITDFLAETTLSSDIDQEVDNSVVLMTVHSAKGLEFPIVFVIGMEEGIFPHARSISDILEIEEERRLAYVALTRAEVRLFVTYCKVRYEYGDPKPKYNKVSRFIKELPKEVVRWIGQQS
jgi:DNA helicase-2/ATP-dependent DNA helicase PcrA